MFKKIGILALVISFIFIFQNESFAFRFFKKAPSNPVVKANKEAVFVPVNNLNDNLIWVGTFQLVWNDLIDEIIKAPVKFSGFQSELADNLNKKGFTTDYISENSYYKKYGNISFKLKKEIETGIKKKFNETSDILNDINWNSDGLLIYAMLKKEFEFLNAFKELPPALFDGTTVKYFGIGSNDEGLKQNVEVLFYNSKDDYAVKLITKNTEDVILYRTDENKTFEEFLKDLNDKAAAFSGNKAFEDGDTLKVPYIKFDTMFQYNELTGKPVEGTDYIIDGAIQTVKFNMDNKGGSLKSEAALIMRMSLRPEISGRRFNFDKPFVLFLKEKNQTVPYFAANFKNAALFEKP